MTSRVVLLIAALLLGSCGVDSSTNAPGEAVRLVMGGDVMLGRGVDAIVEHDPRSILAGVELELAAADLAMVNLESSLTERPVVDGTQYDLRADPIAAYVLAESGIDLVSVANNHAGDAGPEAVPDTVKALSDAGVGAVGGGAGSDDAQTATIRTIGGTRVGVLAFDATGLAPEASDSTPGVARWDDSTSPPLVAEVREHVDVLVVSIHGGAEYLLATDASMRSIITTLAELDVDVVWGHGPHVVHDTSVIDPDGNGRPTLAASSLGNLVFDQTRVRTDRGALLDVMADARGVMAYRVGETIISRGRVSFSSWLAPEGPAALIGAEWWTMTTEPQPIEPAALELEDFAHGDVVSAAVGDVDLDGRQELVVSFRRPFRRAPLNELLGDVQWTDAAGRSAHVGVFEGAGRRPVWVASANVRPVGRIAVCDGAVAVAYSMLDDNAITGAGGWTWSGFGWDEAPDIEGDRSIGCQDVDGDGIREPVVGSMTADES